MNYLKTAILLAGLTALFMGVGYLIGGQSGALIALVIAAGMNIFSYWNSDKMVLSMLAQFGMFFSGNRNNNNGFGIIGTLAMVILAPIAAMLVQMAISRTREYEADRAGAEISGRPLALASALQKIAAAAHHIPNMPAERNPASAHLFIVNPLSGARMDNLFSTHPNVENRVVRLREMARAMGESGASSGSGSGATGPWSGERRVAGRGPWD